MGQKFSSWRRRRQRRGAAEQPPTAEPAETPPPAGEDEEPLSAGVGQTGGARFPPIPSIPMHDDRSPTPSKSFTSEEERSESLPVSSGALGTASKLSSASGTRACVHVCVRMCMCVRAAILHVEAYISIAQMGLVH